jgi:hypothetical protein
MLMPWLAELQRRNAERERADKAMTLAAHPGLAPSWLGYVCPCCGHVGPMMAEEDIPVSDDRGRLEMGKSRFRGW